MKKKRISRGNRYYKCSTQLPAQQKKRNNRTRIPLLLLPFCVLYMCGVFGLGIFNGNLMI